MIWNNLLEPVGAKSNWNPGSRLRCPSKGSPYLMTDKNSDDDDVKRPDKTAFERIGTSSTTSKSMTTELATTKRRRRRKKPRLRRSKEDFESFVYNDEDLGCNIL
jgi:hypothetical protein